MQLRKRLETASDKLKASAQNLDAILDRGKAGQRDFLVLCADVRVALAALQDAERLAAGVKPDRS